MPTLRQRQPPDIDFVLIIARHQLSGHAKIWVARPETATGVITHRDNHALPKASGRATQRGNASNFRRDEPGRLADGGVDFVKVRRGLSPVRVFFLTTVVE
jgi:hypothetical protein